MAGSIVHPAAREVAVGNGHKVTVRPWTMAQRADLRPPLAALIDKVLEFDKDPRAVNLSELFSVAEDEVATIVKASVHLPDGVSWDDILWEDLPALAQAVWETCVLREDGGGVAGKMVGALGSGAARLLTLLPQNEPNSAA